MLRSKFWLPSIFLALLLIVCNSTTGRAQGRYTASYQDFYDGLAPYGQWIQDPQYGYVWLPDVDADFRPYYTNGYWANTQYGNTWVSDYDWGWAPFHYGRWTYDNYYGWLWIPDTEWGPAWVSWRSSNDYYGWAPMGPGININVNLGLIPVDWWVFITPGYFYDRSFYRYCNNDYRFRRNTYSHTTIINYTYIDNRTTYYTGPRADDYYRHTGRRPSMFNIDNNNRRGATRVKGDRISIYRPNMRNAAGAAPARVANTDRAVTRRPQVFNGTAAGARGREMVLRESKLVPAQSIGRTQRMNEGANPSSNQRTPAPGQGSMRGQQRNDQVQTQQQRGDQVQQQRIQQQRVQQDRQRDMQMQQRNDQIQQQRVQQERQRDMQQQQERQRDMQMQQQRMQQQRNDQIQQQQQQERQRDMQMQQQRMQQQRSDQIQQQQQQERQRDMQMQQQRMQQQRNDQIQQQQQQERQRDMQMQQQRMQQQRNDQMQQQREMQRSQIDNSRQPTQMQRESPMRMKRDGAR